MEFAPQGGCPDREARKVRHLDGAAERRTARDDSQAAVDAAEREEHVRMAVSIEFSAFRVPGVPQGLGVGPGRVGDPIDHRLVVGEAADPPLEQEERARVHVRAAIRVDPDIVDAIPVHVPGALDRPALPAGEGVVPGQHGEGSDRGLSGESDASQRADRFLVAEGLHANVAAAVRVKVPESRNKTSPPRLGRFEAPTPHRRGVAGLAATSVGDRLAVAVGVEAVAIVRCSGVHVREAVVAVPGVGRPPVAVGIGVPSGVGGVGRVAGVGLLSAVQVIRAVAR